MLALLYPPVSASQQPLYSTTSNSAYQYHAGNNKIKSIALKGGGSVSFGYDAKGNLKKRNDATEIVYNLFNKPTQITKNGSVSLRYGSDLARVKKTRNIAGNTTTFSNLQEVNAYLFVDKIG